MAMPIWLKDKLFQKKMLFNELKRHDNDFNDNKTKRIIEIKKTIQTKRCLKNPLENKNLNQLIFFFIN